MRHMACRVFPIVTVQRNIRLVQDEYLRCQTDSSLAYGKRIRVEAKIIMKFMDFTRSCSIIEQYHLLHSNITRHQYISSITDRLIGGSFMWHKKRTLPQSQIF
jgi:hypothetical protein